MRKNSRKCLSVQVFAQVQTPQVIAQDAQIAYLHV